MKEFSKKPYQRIIIPDIHAKTFTGMIREFPGCIVEGKTVNQTYKLLNKVAVDWIAVAMDLGQSIPDPLIYSHSRSTGKHSIGYV